MPTQSPTNVALTITRGSTLPIRFRWTVADEPFLDDADWFGRFQVRDRAGTLLLEATTDDPTMSIDAEGWVTIRIEADVTRTIPQVHGLPRWGCDWRRLSDGYEKESFPSGPVLLKGELVVEP